MSIEIPEITLDGTKFQLFDKFMDADRYNIYTVRSTTPATPATPAIPKTFNLYRSVSCVGLLRFCCRVGHQFGKGTNYTQTTVVDMRLQNFINRHENDTLPEHESTRESSCNCSSDGYKQFDSGADDRNDREVKDDYFSMIDSEYKSGKMNEYRTILRKTDNRVANLKLFFDGLSKFVQRGYEYIGHEINVDFAPYSFKVNPNVTITWERYLTITIQKKTDESYKLKLECLQIDYNDTANSCFNGKYAQIIQILPSTPTISTTINLFGLPTYYVPAGAYVSKFFEYLYQCPVKWHHKERPTKLVKSRAIRKDECEYKYMFMSDLMELWPIHHNSSLDKSSIGLPHIPFAELEEYEEKTKASLAHVCTEESRAHDADAMAGGKKTYRRKTHRKKTRRKTKN
jgi:hypothetical protein